MRVDTLGLVRSETATDETGRCEPAGMSRWLQSGRRRDLCYVLAAEGELRGQALKARLEDHYDERIEPRAFYGSLSTLVDAGHVSERTDGLHDVYALTDAGERRLREHHEWVRSQLADSDA